MNLVHKRLSLGVAALICIGMALLWWNYLSPEAKAPSRQEMYRYIISQLNDDELNDIVERSKAEIERERLRAKREGEDFWLKKIET